MLPNKTQDQAAIEEEIARLETEVAAVVALPDTPQNDRASLVDRLRRLKENAGLSQ